MSSYGVSGASAKRPDCARADLAASASRAASPAGPSAAAAGSARARAAASRRGDHVVEGEHVVVQVAMVGGERHGVARLHRVHELHERAHVVLVVVDHVTGVAFEPPADAGVRRRVRAEGEVDRPVPGDEVAQRPAGDLGVVGVEQRDAAAFDDDGRVVT